MLRINPFTFSQFVATQNNGGYTPVDLDKFLQSGDLFQATGQQHQCQHAQQLLQFMQAHLLASMLMQLDPMALAHLIMLGMMANRMNGGNGQFRGSLGNGQFSRGSRTGGWSRGTGGVQNGSGAYTGPTGTGSTQNFLQAALSQQGDRYIYGAETNLNDPNPSAFDCSELVQWAGAQAGVNIPDGSANQRNWVRQHGTEISVDQALRTPGALLFRDGHVAISLGDGRTIEAKGSRYGVGIFEGRGRFTSAGLVPGLS